MKIHFFPFVVIVLLGLLIVYRPLSENYSQQTDEFILTKGISTLNEMIWVYGEPIMEMVDGTHILCQWNISREGPVEFSYTSGRDFTGQKLYTTASNDTTEDYQIFCLFNKSTNLLEDYKIIYQH